MAKATVQAALGPVCLRKLSDDASEEQRHYGEIVLMVCIFSIVLTAPIGAILISISGPRLLTKTKTLPSTEGTLYYILININIFYIYRYGLFVSKCMPFMFSVLCR